jgi:hypothetical protein
MATPVEGSVPLMDVGDIFYIPITPETSGMYGQMVGSHVVGADRDSVLLSSSNSSSEGFVWFVSSFDVSSVLTPELPIVGATADIPLTLILNDVDFLPDAVGGGVTSREWIDLALLDDGGNPIAGADSLVLNVGNYMTFRQDLDGGGMPKTATDDTTGTYEISLMSMFGGFGDDWENYIDLLNQGQMLNLKLTLHAEVDYFGRSRVRVYNTPEDVRDTAVIFGVAPEPASAGMLLVGAAALAVRTRRRFRRA